MPNLTWYLIKAADNQEYGPIDTETLMGWAADAKISPMDKLSSDNRRTWLRAPMIAELQMDWLIQMPDKYLYGPTNVATIQEFLATGEIDENVTVINCIEGVESRLGDQRFFQVSPQHVRSADTTLMGSQWPDQARGGDPMMQQRLTVLERQIIEYQHTVDEWQNAYASLRQQFIEATGREPM